GHVGTGLWSDPACSCPHGAAGLGPACLALAGLASDSGHVGPAWLGRSSARQADPSCSGPARRVALYRRALAPDPRLTSRAPFARRSRDPPPPSRPPC